MTVATKVPKPMLAHSVTGNPALLNDLITATSWAMEPKFDGWRTLLVIEDGGVTLYGGRNGKTYACPPQLTAISTLLPNHTIIDGELIHPDGWGGVQSAMTSNDNRGADLLTLVVFDILELNGTNTRSLRWENRRELLELIEWPEPAAYLSPLMPKTQEAIDTALEQGLEGVMFKWRDSLYVEGRHDAWRKHKPVEDIDAQVIGFEAGEGEFAGLIGALKVLLPNGVETTASGMTLDVRKDMTENPFDYLNKMVEIRHNGMLDSGKVRHPRFVRMRPDRDEEVDPQPVITANDLTLRNDPTPTSGKRKPPINGWLRAYHAMGNAKLANALADFDRGHGDAVDRVVNKGGDVAFNEMKCREEAKKRGLI